MVMMVDIIYADGDCCLGRAENVSTVLVRYRLMLASRIPPFPIISIRAVTVVVIFVAAAVVVVASAVAIAYKGCECGRRRR